MLFEQDFKESPNNGVETIFNWIRWSKIKAGYTFLKTSFIKVSTEIQTQNRDWKSS